jgi:imidazole glycerol-phosphate synthase subunit HisH
VRTTVIIDSGGANIASVGYAMKRLGAQVRVSSDQRTIRRAGRVLLPGVGAAAHSMSRLKSLALIEVLTSLTQPVLGICLGMQLLFKRSEEGSADCLGVIPGTVRHLEPQPQRPVPHMGWNTLEALKQDPLLEDLAAGDYAYFVHSYAAPVTEDTLATTTYGGRVAAIVRRGNFWGTQFHPERSGAIGAQILRNFLRL